MLACWTSELSSPGLSPGQGCCILGQDTLLSQCLSPPRSTNGYQQTRIICNDHLVMVSAFGWTPDRAIQVRAMARVSVLCSWAIYVTLTVPLSIQEYINVYWQQNARSVTYNGLASHPGGVMILLVASCYRNRDKLQPLWATRLMKTFFKVENDY